MNPTFVRWLRWSALGVAGGLLLVVFALGCTYVYLAPSLPDAARMHDLQMAVPLTILTSDGQLISQIGEERRVPVSYEDIPPLVREAVLAAEDDRFFEHNGVDWMGFTRAVFKVVSSGRAVQGGSTITQQAARQLYLSLDKTLRRKLSELFVTWRMERDFSKEQILSLYLTKIFFGQRSYGIVAAAQTYYGKPLNELTVAQAATLAGIIQVPSHNPISDPKVAAMRRHYVLGRMLKLGYIDKPTADAAAGEPVASRGYAPLSDVEAPYVAEMARQYVITNFGEDAVNAGYKVHTTLIGSMQTAANAALRGGLMAYDQRHGFRGRIGKASLATAPTTDELDDALDKYKSVNELQPAIVTEVGDTSAEVYVKDQGNAHIGWDGLSWARRTVGDSSVGPAPRKAEDVVKRGDVVYVVTEKGSTRLSQLPAAQSALVAVDPHSGAIEALTGGFDFYYNAFNRVTQARRQPGSGFKPFLYSAALENGFTAATTVLNQPPVMDESSDSEEHPWRPENSNGELGGPTRVREGLVHSLNDVSARMLQSIGINTGITYAARFGFDPATLPKDLTLSLGTLSATPLQMATAYAVFANGGYKVDTYFITSVQDEKGNVVFQAQPKMVCPDCELPDGSANPAGSVPVERRAPRVISAQNAWLMTDIMHDVATRGTGKRTQELGRDDLAGKTGTTDKPVRDNWFNGFNANLVATVWVGYDDERSLGESEEGASTALPIWIDFMRDALKGMPSARLPRPPGIVDVPVSTLTGDAVPPGDPNAMDEVFMTDHLPPGAQLQASDPANSSGPVEVIATKPVGSTTSTPPLF